jgi:hypothetical protein
MRTYLNFFKGFEYDPTAEVDAIVTTGLVDCNGRIRGSGGKVADKSILKTCKGAQRELKIEGLRRGVLLEIRYGLRPNEARGSYSNGRFG